MTIQIIALILSLAVLIWVETASAQTTHRLSVSRHHAVPPLSEGEVRTILARASKVLRKNSHHTSDDDFACDVTFRLKDPVRAFASPASPIVDRDNIDAVHRVNSDLAGVDFGVKVVEEIRFCRPDLPNPDGLFDGCAFSPPDFRSIIVVHPELRTNPQHPDGPPLDKYPDHLLWAHEFGHLTGLPHRPDRFALMTPCSLTRFRNVPVTRVLVNRAECRHYRSGPGAQPAQALGCQPGM